MEHMKSRPRTGGPRQAQAQTQEILLHDTFSPASLISHPLKLGWKTVSAQLSRSVATNFRCHDAIVPWNTGFRVLEFGSQRDHALPPRQPVLCCQKHSPDTSRPICERRPTTLTLLMLDIQRNACNARSGTRVVYLYKRLPWRTLPPAAKEDLRHCFVKRPHQQHSLATL